MKRAFAPDARVGPRVSAKERSQLGAGKASFEIEEMEIEPMSVMVEVVHEYYECPAKTRAHGCVSLASLCGFAQTRDLPGLLICEELARLFGAGGACCVRNEDG